MKTRHLHAILATVHIAIEYDPQDIAALTTLNAQIREQCRKLTGYRDIEIRLGKVPAPIPTVTTVTMPMVEQDTDNGAETDDMPEMPEQLRRA